ncbi:hypothetical protein [Candidatus Protofrankia californiensis]|uniref:hypothetical protein n=1 Tax=Candidatus Protofrankia californiensis TaxID=1839754 RepID=UPI0010417F5D|nr:hypothetical protein [Candidatus Protofrankia californiensis]
MSSRRAIPGMLTGFRGLRIDLDVPIVMITSYAGTRGEAPLAGRHAGGACRCGVGGCRMAQWTGRGCHPRRGRRRGRAVPGLGGLRRRPAGRPQAGNTDLAGVADRLADQLGQLWSAEAKRRGLNRPPLTVSWRPADPALVQPWSHLQRLVTDGAGWTPRAYPAADPGELAGAGHNLIKVLDRVPTGRLIVLGEPVIQQCSIMDLWSTPEWICAT